MKVSFIGAGRVGSTAAFSTMLEYMPDEIVLVDVIPKLAKAQAMDLTHAAIGFDIPVKITGTTSLSGIKDSDVVVVTAGRPRKPGETRIQLLRYNAGIIESISKKIKRLAKNSIVIIVTNPVDPLVYLAWKETGFKRTRVFGVGSMVDTARLIASNYDGLVIGQHGKFFTPIVSQKRLEKAISDVKRVNEDLLKWKGRTEFGPAMEITEAVGAVIDDLGCLMPVSAILEGEYGLNDVSIGVPATICREGISNIIEIKMNKLQRDRFLKGALEIKKAIGSVIK